MKFPTTKEAKQMGAKAVSVHYIDENDIQRVELFGNNEVAGQGRKNELIKRGMRRVKLNITCVAPKFGDNAGKARKDLRRHCLALRR